MSKTVLLIGGECHGRSIDVHDALQDGDIVNVPGRIDVELGPVQDFDASSILTKHEYRLHDFHWWDGEGKETTRIGIPSDVTRNPFRFVADIAFKSEPSSQ